VSFFFFLQNIFSDVNECELDLDGCAQNCSNTIGAYYCSCMNGYNLDSDGHSCTGTYVSCGLIPQRPLLCLITFVIADINECATVNLCDGNAICENTNGSYTCQCSSGWTGDGYNCTSKKVHSSP